MMRSRSSEKLLSAWTPDRQQAWRQAHPKDLLIFHCLLDASGSMAAYEEPLRKGYNLYLRHLQRSGQSMALLDTRCFGSVLAPANVQALGLAAPLTAETYSATMGGTDLWQAVITMCTTAPERGQHVLIVFTDGADNHSMHSEPVAVRELLTTLQDTAGWLCVFLGAYDAALPHATAMGFRDGNILTFPNERIPAAFETLRVAIQRFLVAPDAERKLLAAGGIF